jgi:hypothetical protein
MYVPTVLYNDSKTDYGIVILADSRYNRADKRSKLPPWIVQFIRESSLNLSTDLAMDQMKAFLKVAGQPIDQQALQTILFDRDQVAGLAQQFQHHIASHPFAAAVVSSDTATVAAAAAAAITAARPLSPSSSQQPMAVVTTTAVVTEGEDRLESLYQEELENILGGSGGRMDVSRPEVREVAEQVRVAFKPPEYPTSLFLFEDILDAEI